MTELERIRQLELQVKELRERDRRKDDNIRIILKDISELQKELRTAKAVLEKMVEII